MVYVWAVRILLECILVTYVFTLYYRPQRSCEGYVFTGVCLFELCSDATIKIIIHYATCLSMGGSTWPGTPPRGPGTPLPDQVHPPEIWPLLRTVRILLECILVLICWCITMQWRIQDFPWFGGGVSNPQSGCANLFFLAENCMKMKEFGLPGGRRPWRPLGSANALCGRV